MKKRMIALALAMLMVCMGVLSGCGKRDDGSASGGSSQGGSEAAQEQEETGKPQEETAQDKAESEERDFSEIRGTVSDGVYTNKFFGLSFDASDSSTWKVADEAALAELMGIVAATVSDEEFRKSFEKSGSFFDFFVENPNDYSNINVLIQDVGILYGSLIDIDTYISEAPKVAAEALEKQGLANVKSELSTTEFLGDKDARCVLMNGEMQGFRVCQRQTYVKKGRYICIITATCFGDDVTADRIAAFKAI